MNDNRKNLIWVNLFCIFGILVVTIPLLIMGHYNYPSADDWSFGAATYQVIKRGGNLFDVLREAFDVAMLWREKGEPRYANAFLGALQPGIWGEHFYRVTPWIMIGSLIFSEIFLGQYLLKYGGCRNGKWIAPAIIPSLIMQLLFVPYPVETFYWYTGAVNYTFIFSLSLILLTVFLKLKEGNNSRGKTVIMIIVGSLLAVIVGGDSYAASLSSVCVFCTLSICMIIHDKPAFIRTLPITLITSIGLIVCLIAPGNQVRLEEFGGTTTGAFYAIAMSIWRTGLNIYSWTSWKILLMLILIMPFLWKALKDIDYNFRYPVVYTLFTFGIYASQIVATMYVDGSTGGRRMADVLYYAYHVWVLLNMGYWLGWLQRKKNLEILRFIGNWKERINKHLLLWFLTIGAALAIVICITDLTEVSTYRACVWLIKGYAKDYAAAWEERLVILKDESVKEVFFEHLPGLEEMVFYADFQPGENWVNDACEIYYEKDYIGLK